MHFDIFVALAGLIVGVVVGLTGMGGGALMTPILVLFFGVQPLAAVSSDLVASFVMKPVGGERAPAPRHGATGRSSGGSPSASVPAAFAGVLVLRALGDGGRDAEPREDRARRRAAAGRPGSIVIKAAAAARARRPKRTGRGSGAKRPRACRSRFGRRPTMLIGAGRRAGRRHDLGRLGLADHRGADAALPDAVGEAARRHRPGAGRAAGRGRALGHILFGDFELGLTPSLLSAASPASTSAPGCRRRPPAASCGRCSPSCCWLPV